VLVFGYWFTVNFSYPPLFVRLEMSAKMVFGGLFLLIVFVFFVLDRSRVLFAKGLFYMMR